MDRNTQHAEMNERKWDARAATYDYKRFDYFRWMQQRVIRLIALRPGLRFLDIGCGIGWAVRYMASLLPKAPEQPTDSLSGQSPHCREASGLKPA